MSSGKRSGFGDWDKGDTRYHDVGLGLRLQHQQNEVFSPSGEGLSRVPFTANQRQELERQTMIYKYMMSSMPVPPELIIPLSKYPSSANLPPLLQHNDQPSGRKGLELRYNGSGRGGGGVGGGDPEPWRCRRTDGKKWRCSRDVAPDQKYCERHSHKGRPSARSRKPVESSLLASSSSASTTTNTASTTSNPIILNPYQHHPSSYDLSSSLPQYNNQHPSLRYPEWFMKEEVVPAAHVLYPQQVEQIGLENRGHTSHFSHRSSPSDRTTRPLPRPFIDAWSLEDVHKVANTNNPTSTANAVSNVADFPTEVTRSNKRPTPSSANSILPLTLSMSAGFDPDNSQNNNKDDDHEAIREIRSSQQQPSNWMSSWINLPSGGPLAEALCLGISSSTNAWGNHSEEMVSPHGHSSSSTSTTMSSKGSHASGDTGGQGFQFRH